MILNDHLLVCMYGRVWFRGGSAVLYIGTACESNTTLALHAACERDTGGCGEAKHAIPDVFIQRGKEDAMQPVIACESGGGWPMAVGRAVETRLWWSAR